MAYCGVGDLYKKGVWKGSPLRHHRINDEQCVLDRLVLLGEDIFIMATLYPPRLGVIVTVYR